MSRRVPLTEQAHMGATGRAGPESEAPEAPEASQVSEAPEASRHGDTSEATLRSLLPGWIEPATTAWFVSAGSPVEVEAAVRAAWASGELHHDDGMWWTPVIARAHIDAGGPGAVAGARVRTPGVVAALASMRRLCDEGRPDEALAESVRTVGEVLGRADQTPDVERDLSEIAIATILALVDAGRIHVADVAARSAHAESIRRQAPLGQGWYAAMLGIAELAAGRIIDARRSMVEARLLGRLCGDGELMQLARSGIELSHALVGDRRPVIVEPLLDPVAGEDDPGDAGGGVPSMPGGRARVRAWASASAANLAELADSARAERSAGRFGRAATLAGELAMLGDPSSACTIFRRFGPLDGDLLPLWPAIAAALADRDATVLDDAASKLEGSGLMGLSSALTLMAAGFVLELDPERSRTLMREANRRGRGVQHGERYLAQFRRLLPLRDREREIAELAARRLTNRQIAEQLVLSVRTVENHLYRVYDKLGIEGRADLIDLFAAATPA